MSDQRQFSLFNSVNKKLFMILALLLACICGLAVVALWGVGRQDALLQDVTTNVQGVLEKTGGLGTKLDEANANADRIGQMAAQLGEEFKGVQKLIETAEKSGQLARDQDLNALAGTALQLLDRRIETAKFLSDAAVKSSDVRKSALGFYVASMEDFGETSDIKLPDGVDAYDDQGTLNDFVGALVSSANANFYVVLGLEGKFRGKGLFSNESDLFEADLKECSLFKVAIRENRTAKGLTRIGDKLAIASAAFMKSDSGKDVGMLTSGYWLDAATLRFLSDDLQTQLALFIADDSGKIDRVAHSTLVDANGNLLLDVPLPGGLVADYTKRIGAIHKAAKNKGSAVDGHSVAKDFRQCRRLTPDN